MPSKNLTIVLLFAVALAVPAWAQDAPQSEDDRPLTLIARAMVFYRLGDCASSVPVAERAASKLRSQGDSSDLALAIVTQALCLKKLARFADAERLYREAIGIYERVQGLNGPDLGVVLDNLGSLYAEQGRLAEAERLRLRALEIFRSTLAPDHPDIATALANIAVLYQAQGRLSDALSFYAQAFDIGEKAYGPESREVGIMADNLAGLYRSQGRFKEAESFYLRAVSIFEKEAGPDHPDTALALQNYAILLVENGRHEQAEANIRRAIGINERLYGPDHGSVAAALNNLSIQYIEQGRWNDALETLRRSTGIILKLSQHGNFAGPTEGGQKSSAFRRLAQVAFAIGPADPEFVNEGFVAAQRAVETEASAALSQLGARFAKNDRAFAVLMRERQDLLIEAGDRDRRLVAAVARSPDWRDAAAEARERARIDEIHARIEAIDQSLGEQFPNFAALSHPSPLTIAEVQALLAPGEVLAQFIDLQAVGDVAETGFAWFVSKTEVKWVRLPIGTAELSRAVATLRCGLDSTSWTDARAWVAATSEEKFQRQDQMLRRERCKALTGVEVSDQDAPPFDLAKAHALYLSLFGDAGPLLLNPDGTGKQLLVVPSGPLTTLPFQVLVTEAPAAGYDKAAWLVARHAVTVLPSVTALQELRKGAKASKGTKPFVGFGNPLLVGHDGTDTRAFEKQTCSKPGPDGAVIAQLDGKQPTALRAFRGTAADVDSLRRQTPLPETADELCAVAAELGAPDGDVFLGANATEAQVAKMSADGTLATARVIQFATHGLIASETRSLDKALAEPALLLTPPEKAVDGEDGLLTASEVTDLKLDADWVVLSACNTAAGGEGGDAEALSGLARAFFYSGARALLVSHWYVDSSAAVKLTTGAFAELKRNPAIGRAEAMRRSMLAAMADASRPAEWIPASHPAVWAPFVLVGEGGADIKPKAPARKKTSKGFDPDWATKLFAQ